MGIVELTEEFMKQTGLTGKKKIMKGISGMFESISKATEEGQKVTIKGFGTFKRVTRVARTYDTCAGKVSKPDRRFLKFNCVDSQKKVVS